MKDDRARSLSSRGSRAPFEERSEEVEEILRVDDAIRVEVGPRFEGKEGGDEVEEILRVRRAVEVEVRGAGGSEYDVIEAGADARGDGGERVCHRHPHPPARD